MNAREGASFVQPGRTVELFGVQPGMSVADFGAGSGHYTLAFADVVGASGRVYAIDVQRDLLRRIDNEAKRRGLNNVHSVAGDIERPHGTKLADTLVDVVLLSNVLFQIENKTAAFIEARRILKKPGILVVIEWIDSFRSMGPIRKHLVPKDTVVDVAHGNRFRYVDEFEAGAHHYGLVFRPV